MSDREDFLERKLNDLHIEVKEVSQKQVEILKLVKTLINNQKYLLDSIQGGFKKQEFLVNNLNSQMKNDKVDICNKFVEIGNDIEIINEDLQLIKEGISDILSE